MVTKEAISIRTDREWIFTLDKEADRENPRRSKATLRIFAGRLTQDKAKRHR